MLGSYSGGSQRRLTPNGEGVTIFTGLEGHFDGRREIFVNSAGPSSQALTTGKLVNTGYPFQVNSDNGTVRFEPSSDGRNRPGVRIIHPDTAPVAQAPYASYTMRDGAGGADQSWTVGFVYSWSSTISGGGLDAQIFEFTCDNVDVRFYLYDNSAILWGATVDRDGASEVYGSSGATVPSAFWATPNEDIYAMLFSHFTPGGFYFRNINLTRMLEATYSEPQGYQPAGYASSKAWVEGTGTATFGYNVNMSPGDTKDFTIHEAFYVDAWVQSPEQQAIFDDWHRKWVMKT